MNLIAPTEIIGKEKKSGGFTKTNPKSWSAEELSWCKQKKSEGYSTAEIANALQRSEVSVQIKLKRQNKSNDSYNEKHRDSKYYANELFFEKINPNSCLDVYAGKSWWAEKTRNCITNDVDKNFNTDYHLDAFELMCKLYLEDKKFDVIDLDPFGSAYECFDFAFRMAKKGVVISFGEWGHKRWKRTDFVHPRYGIQSVEEYKQEAFIKEAQRISKLHKKNARVFNTMQYANFLRVYFILEPFKEVSQWEKTA